MRKNSAEKVKSYIAGRCLAEWIYGNVRKQPISLERHAMIVGEIAGMMGQFNLNQRARMLEDLLELQRMSVDAG
jgi:hypothetical protein